MVGDEHRLKDAIDEAFCFYLASDLLSYHEMLYWRRGAPVCSLERPGI